MRDAKFWRYRAEEFRAIADGLKSTYPIEAFLRLAAEADNLAARLEANPGLFRSEPGGRDTNWKGEKPH